MNDDDVAWDLNESYIYAMSKFLTCEEENGKYYYILFGRLVFVSDSLLSKSYRFIFHEVLGMCFIKNFFSETRCYCLVFTLR